MSPPQYHPAGAGERQAPAVAVGCDADGPRIPLVGRVFRAEEGRRRVGRPATRARPPSRRRTTTTLAPRCPAAPLEISTVSPSSARTATSSRPHSTPPGLRMASSARCSRRTPACGSRKASSHFSRLASNVAAACGSGMRRWFSSSANCGKRPELAPAPFGHLPSQLGLVVGEVEERRGGRPLLAHEQQRRFGRAGAGPRRRAVGGRSTRWFSRSPKARLPTWSWFWMQKTNVRSGMPGGSVPARPPVVLGVLARVEPAAADGRPAMSAVEPREIREVAVAVAGQGAPHWWWKSSAQRPSRPQPAVGRRANDRSRLRSSSAITSEPALRRGDVPHALRQVGEEVAAAVVVQGVGGIQPQAVEVIFAHPVPRVLDEEAAHPVAARAVEVDRPRPTGSCGREEARREDAAGRRRPGRGGCRRRRAGRRGRAGAPRSRAREDRRAARSSAAGANREAGS